MARTKQTARSFSHACAQAQLELKAEADKQIETWQQANQEAAPTQDGLLARLRARLFSPRRPSAQEVAEPFDVLAELPHDLRILVFIEAGPASLARLALTSKPWSTLVARNLPQAPPPPSGPGCDVNARNSFRGGLGDALKAVASRMHPVEVCLLMRELRETMRKSALPPHADYVTKCNPLYRSEWTPELLLDVVPAFDGFWTLSSGDRTGVLRFVRPLIAEGRFKQTEALIKAVRGAYCNRSQEEFDFLVDFHVKHLQEHEEGMAEAWQDEDHEEEEVTYQTAEWEEAMTQLGTLVGKESPRLPMQSVLYILDRALDDSWRAAAAAGMGDGDADQARMEHRVACFFRAWAPAVDFPASWPAEDVAAWFAPWCKHRLHTSTIGLREEFDDEYENW